MWHLMKSELLRFRGLALGFALAHLLLLRVVSMFTDLYLPSMAKLMPGVVLYSLCGLILGIYQYGSYRSINRWTYLIHRPLQPWRIFLALSGAGALLLFLVIGMPWVLVTALVDGLAGQWVDLRHYWMGAFLFGTSLSFYLAGAYITLSKAKAALVALGLPVFFLTWHAVGLWIFVPQLAVVLALAALALSVFKPDLSTPVRKPAAVAVNAVALQLVFLMAVTALSGTLFQVGLITSLHGVKGFSVHDWSSYFPEGTYGYVDYSTGQPEKVLAHGLALLDSEHGEFLKRQLALTETASVPLHAKRYPAPVRHQLLHADRNLVLVDEEHEEVWTFRHDRMLFEGRSTTSGASAGWLGVRGPGEAENTVAETERFERVPLVLGNRWLLTERRLYQFDPKTREVRERFVLPEGERVLSTWSDHGSFTTLVSDRALYLLEAEDSEDELSRLVAEAVVPLPDDGRYLQGVEVAELLDGYLFSFLYGQFDNAGYVDSRQVVVELGSEGRMETLAERPLVAGLPALYRYRAFVASPVVESFRDLLWSGIAPRRWSRVGFSEIATRRVPGSVLWAALAVALLSAILTAWVARRRRLTPRQRWGWTVGSFLTGVPGLLSFLFLTPKREQLPRSAPVGLTLAPALEEA